LLVEALPVLDVGKGDQVALADVLAALPLHVSMDLHVNVHLGSGEGVVLEEDDLDWKLVLFFSVLHLYRPFDHDEGSRAGGQLQGLSRGLEFGEDLEHLVTM
jgi:hypothetical protein